MNTEDRPEPASQHRLHRTILIVLLVAGIAMKIYGAWCYRHSTDTNFAINALMARHMALFKDFPVFYYGQEYMGSAEQLAAVPFCWVMGCTGFAVNLGAALMGVLMMFVVFAWARRIGGPVAGLAALALCVIGPETFFRYHAASLGYGVITLLGTVVLWAASRAVEDRLDTGRYPIGWLFLCGLAAGLGWWSSQLIMFSVFAAAATFVLFLHVRMFDRRLLAGVAGGIFGASPWLVWNMLNDFRSLKVASSFNVDGFATGVRMLLTRAALYLVDAFELKPALKWPLAALYVAVLLTAIIVFLVAVFRPQRSSFARYRPSLAALLAIFPIAALIFSLTKFGQEGSTRYLLPLYPPLAIFAGLATALLARRVRHAAWILPALLVISQLPVLGIVRRVEREYAAPWTAAQELRTTLRQLGVDGVYSSYAERWLNFALEEEFVFWPLNGVRYRPYWDRIERARRPAVLRNAGAVETLIQSGSASMQRTTAGDMTLYYDFNLAAESRAEVERPRIASIKTTEGADFLDPLLDRTAETAWEKPADSEEFLEVDFKQAVTASSVRVFFKTDARPDRWQILARTADNDDWQPLTGIMGVSGFQWSGPRPYWRGQFAWLECRFAPRGVTALRITFPAERRPRVSYLSELQVFEPAVPTPSEASSLDELQKTLKELRMRRIYSERWVGAMLAERAGDRLDVRAEPYISDSSDRSFDPHVRFDRRTALLVRTENAPMTGEALARAKITMTAHTLGPWTLYLFEEADWMDGYRKTRSILWTGFSGVVADRRSLALGYACIAESLPERNPSDQTSTRLLEESLKLLPRNPPVALRLAAIYRAEGLVDKASALEEGTRGMWDPAVPAEIEFRNGVRFLGITLDRTDVRPGESVRVRYFWKCPEDFRDDSLAVFTHLASPDRVFQDDRPFQLEGIEYQPYETTLVEERTITVPQDAPAGSYEIRLGLYDMKGAKRVGFSSDLPSRRRAAMLPAVLRVK